MKEFKNYLKNKVYQYESWATNQASGLQIPKSDILVKVADYFGVSVDYLLDRETPSHTDIDLEKALDNAMTFEGRALTDEERTAMKEILKAYLKTKK